MKSIVSHWYCVKEVMPANDNEYRVLRCLTKDGSQLFLMGFFEYDFGDWVFYDEKYDLEENQVTVTHWCDATSKTFEDSFHTIETGVQLL